MSLRESKIVSRAPVAISKWTPSKQILKIIPNPKSSDLVGTLQRFTLQTQLHVYKKAKGRRVLSPFSVLTLNLTFNLARQSPHSRVSLSISAFCFSNDLLPLLRSTDGRYGGRRAFSNRCWASTAGLLPVCCWWWCISPLLSLLWTLFKHIPAAAALV